MAEIHQWRRMIQPSRSRSQDLKGAQEQFAESGNIGSMSRTRRFSTEHVEDQSTCIRLRPKSRLASYLGTHRSFSSPEKPDGALCSASSTNNKDQVYDPDPLQMSYTIQKRLLAFPAEGLPAQQNSLLMHLIEAFRDLSVNRMELLEKLDGEKRRREADLHHFQCSEHTWLEEREIHKLKIVNLESDLARIVRGSPISTALLVASSQAGPHAESGDILGVTSKGRTPRQEKTMDSDWKSSSHYQGPSSPSRHMARLSKRLLTSNTDAELLPTSLSTSVGQAPMFRKHGGTAVVGSSTAVEWAASVNKCVSDSDPSSVEGDLLPDEEALIVAPTAQIVKAGSAIRLTKWLANRIGSDPEEIFPEIAELLYGISMAGPNDLPRLGPDNAEKPLPRLPGPATASPATDVTQSAVQRSASAEDLPLRVKPLYHQGHSRGFSFLPGDDARQPVNSSTADTIGNIKPPPLMEVATKYMPLKQSTPGMDPSMSFAGPTLSPQRKASAESAKTAIRGSTSRSSSESIRASSGTRLRAEGSEGRSKRLKNYPTAVAAARAASNTGSTSRWQERAINPTGQECNQPLMEGLQGGTSYAGVPSLGDVYHLLGLKQEEGHK